MSRTDAKSSLPPIIDGTGALDWKVERVLTEMRLRGLLLGAL